MTSKKKVDNSQSLDLKNLVYNSIEQGNKPLRLDSILRILKLPRRTKKEIEDSLNILENEGKLIYLRGAWSSTSRLKKLTGVVSIKSKNNIYVNSDDIKEKIFISSVRGEAVWDGDIVNVLLLPGRFKGMIEGRILSVLKRPDKVFPVVVISEAKDFISNKKLICEPIKNGVSSKFIVDYIDNLSVNDILLIKPVKGINTELWSAEVIEKIAKEDDPKAQEILCKYQHQIPTEFLEETLNQARKLPKNPLAKEVSERQDLQHLNFVTIDGADAKDFDDAICVIANDSNLFTLFVAIADVAHYVTPGSCIDKEAFLRGNSYYFPGSVEPMLPENLSNGLCSLAPNVPRLAVVAKLQISFDGNIVSSDFFEAVIKSKARLTYEDVKLFIAEDYNGLPNVSEEIKAMLKEAFKLGSILENYHIKNGSLDFNLPEPVIVLNDNKVTKILNRERNLAHKLIEFFMIAANEAVASFLEKKKSPVVYRVHPAPSQEKMTALISFLRQSTLPEEIISLIPRPKKSKDVNLSSTELQKILLTASKLPQAYVINRMILRSMMQAQYSFENEGHFGLASKSYCHFTSPIRRYSDLLTHRFLKSIITSNKIYDGVEISEYEKIIKNLTLTERRAVDAERDIQKRLAILFLQDKVGEEFKGIVSGVTSFGIFVEITDYIVEGMILLSSLTNDYYTLNQDKQEVRGVRTGTTLSLGQELNIKIDSVNLTKLEINLIPIGEQFLSKKNTKSSKLGKKYKYRKPRKKR